MKKIKIMLDFFQGPIWLSDAQTGEPMTGISVIDTDPLVRELNRKCGDLFYGYYHFDKPESPCVFDFEKEKKDKFVMLELITQLVKRLEEINDGTFVVEDCETERLKKL